MKSSKISGTETCIDCEKESNCELIKNREDVEPEMEIDNLPIPEALKEMDGCRFWEKIKKE